MASLHQQRRGQVIHSVAEPIYIADAILSAAEVRALNATQIDLTEDIDDVSTIVPLYAVASYKYATAAFAGIAAGEDLVIRHQGLTQALITIETTGFLDQATAQVRLAHRHATSLALSNIDAGAAKGLPLEIFNSGAITGGGTSTLTIRTFFTVIPTDI